MTNNRPVKEIDFFNELKEDITFQKDTHEIRQYLKLNEFDKKIGFSIHDVNWFLRNKKITPKYNSKRMFSLKSNTQKFENAIDFLMEKYQILDQYFEWLKNFLIDENYLHVTVLDVPIITYTKELNEALQRHDIEIEEMDKYILKANIEAGWQFEHGNIEDDFKERIDELDEKYPISIKISPFVSPGKVAEFIRSKQVEIEEIQKKYRGDFNKRIGVARKKTDIVSKEETFIMKLYFEHKTIDEIEQAVDVLHGSDDKTLFREFNKSRIRKIIKKRLKFGI